MATRFTSARICFGAFEADLNSGELRKQGIRIKLHDQPFQILAMLLEHPGEVVTREQLRQKLWAADTFVDFDVGLNSAVKRLRDALGDSADSPRFVETLPRRGYRLIVSAERVEPVAERSPTGGETSIVSTGNGVPSVTDTGIKGSGISELPPHPPPSEESEELDPATSFPELPKPGTSKPQLTTIWTRLAVVAVLLAVAAGGLWWLIRPTRYRIAVLPFKNMSQEPNSEYFSDGLTDEIIRNLSIIDGLEVKSETSSFVFKDKPRNIHEVGAQLGANLVLEGSVLRSGDKLRINAQLIRVSDDSPLWSGHFDRELKDVFSIQDEISRSIVNELRLKLGNSQRRYNTNLEAYDLYLKADTLAVLHGGQLPQSINLFEQVIAEDPEFAPAYAGLSVAYTQLSASPRSFPAEIANAKMREASEKALQLDPLLAEAYEASGLVYSRDFLWPQAEKALRRSLELNPNSSRARANFAVWVLLPQSRFEEALEQMLIASKLDPLSPSVLNARNYISISAGRYDDVLNGCQTVLAANNVDTLSRHIEQICARALMQKGRLNEAIPVFERHGEETGGAGWQPGFLGYAYAKAGRRREAEQLATRFPNWPWSCALIYSGLGEKDHAVECLEKMNAIHDPRTASYMTYPELSLLRGDARANKLRLEMNLPPN